MKLNEKELELLKRMFMTTWSYIAPDLGVESPTDRDTVFEVCADADRLLTFANTNEEKAMARKFFDLPWAEQEALKETVLPFALYE